MLYLYLKKKLFKKITASFRNSIINHLHYNNQIGIPPMKKRQIKKTLISYEDTSIKKQEQQKQKQKQERSREKPAKVEVVDMSSRKARLAMLKNRQVQENRQVNKEVTSQPVVSINCNLEKNQINKCASASEQIGGQEKQGKAVKLEDPRKIEQLSQQNQESQQNAENRAILKPVFLSKQDRDQTKKPSEQIQQQRKKKAIKYTTKLLLLQNSKQNQQQQEQIIHSSDDENRTDIPDDDDQKQQQLQYELWKIRELKRVRRDREERRKMEIEKVEILRRRKMNNQEILLENKVMGSDATDNLTETKYVYMQKYYHKGAFYQDSQDPIFKRDYNLPTPLQMQDKSMLPQILQKRAGNFGKKGQSKYKHLTAEDTTNFNPQFRPDQSILNNWKKKTAGYKGASGTNI